MKRVRDYTEPNYSMYDLPQELIHLIITNTSLEDILAFCKTSTYFEQYCKKPQLWQLLIERDFGVEYLKIKDPSQTWNQYYIDLRDFELKLEEMSSTEQTETQLIDFYNNIKHTAYKLKMLIPHPLSEPFFESRNDFSDRFNDTIVGNIIFSPYIDILAEDIIAKYPQYLLPLESYIKDPILLLLVAAEYPSSELIEKALKTDIIPKEHVTDALSDLLMLDKRRNKAYNDDYDFDNVKKDIIMLLDYGADPTSVLLLLIENKHLTYLNLLMEYGADPQDGFKNVITTRRKYSTSELIEFFDYFVEKGAKLDFRLLILAIKRNNLTAVKYIITKGNIPVTQELINLAKSDNIREYLIQVSN